MVAPFFTSLLTSPLSLSPRSLLHNKPPKEEEEEENAKGREFAQQKDFFNKMVFKNIEACEINFFGKYISEKSSQNSENIAKKFGITFPYSFSTKVKYILARQSESYEKLFLLNCSSSPRLRRRLYTGVPTKAKGGRERGGRRKRSFILISRASKRENKHRIAFVLFYIEYHKFSHSLFIHIFHTQEL